MVERMITEAHVKGLVDNYGIDKYEAIGFLNAKTACALNFTGINRHDRLEQNSMLSSDERRDKRAMLRARPRRSLHRCNYRLLSSMKLNEGEEVIIKGRKGRFTFRGMEGNMFDFVEDDDGYYRSDRLGFLLCGAGNA